MNPTPIRQKARAFSSTDFYSQSFNNRSLCWFVCGCVFSIGGWERHSWTYRPLEGMRLVRSHISEHYQVYQCFGISIESSPSPFAFDDNRAFALLEFWSRVGQMLLRPFSNPQAWVCWIATRMTSVSGVELTGQPVPSPIVNLRAIR